MRHWCRWLVVVAAVLLVVSGGVPAAATPHEDRPRNLTVVPATAQDHYPGNEEASYKRFAAPNEDSEFESLKYIEYAVTASEALTLGQCDLADAEVAGIDRGNDDPGTEIDDEFGPDNIKGQPVKNEDRVVIEFITPDDPVGEPVNFEAVDQFVGHQTDCYGNPDEPGWYQLYSKINGTTYDGDHREFPGRSHYFYICECDSYDEAVETLGPPPSREGEVTLTATATATAEPTPTRTPPSEGTPFPSPTPSPTSTATVEPTPTRTQTDTATAGPSTPTATDTPAAWAANTPASGPGFGIVVALATLLAAALLARRR